MTLFKTPKGRPFVIESATSQFHSSGVRECSCRISDLKGHSRRFFQLTNRWAHIDIAWELPTEQRNIAIFNCIASDLLPTIDAWMDVWHTD